jgi:Mn2+/Fe2+ NRAMP family transporter
VAAVNSTALTLVAAIMVPMVAALQSFAVAYGYKGWDAEPARRHAWRVFFAVSAVVVFILIFKWQRGTL